MFFKPKPTVTPEDKEWIEDAFKWFEEQYSEEYLKNVQIIEPTQDFFDHKFSGKEEDAEFVLEQVMEYMEVKAVDVELYYFSEAPLEFEDEGVQAYSDSENYAVGKYSENGGNNIRIGLEMNQLKNPQGMIATIAHELSHLILLGEGRLEENDEELTDLNCIALGFGIFISNSIFNFQQWHGTSHQGWNASRQGYIPEEVAAYAMAYFNQYQNNTSDWHRHLNRSVGKLYQKNVKYLQSI